MPIVSSGPSQSVLRGCCTLRGIKEGSRKMTDQNCKRFGWWTLFGGIPLAVVLTWIFTAGILRGNFESVKEAALESVRINQIQDARLLRLEVNYDHVRASIDEIKNDLKDIKRAVERKQ
jgi:hypothetical protein